MCFTLLMMLCLGACATKVSEPPGMVIDPQTLKQAKRLGVLAGDTISSCTVPMIQTLIAQLNTSFFEVPTYREALVHLPEGIFVSLSVPILPSWHNQMDAIPLSWHNQMDAALAQSIGERLKVDALCVVWMPICGAKTGDLLLIQIFSTHNGKALVTYLTYRPGLETQGLYSFTENAWSMAKEFKEFLTNSLPVVIVGPLNEQSGKSEREFFLAPFSSVYHVNHDFRDVAFDGFNRENNLVGVRFNMTKIIRENLGMSYDVSWHVGRTTYSLVHIRDEEECEGVGNKPIQSLTLLAGPRVYRPLGKVTLFAHAQAGVQWLKISGEEGYIIQKLRMSDVWGQPTSIDEALLWDAIDRSRKPIACPGIGPFSNTRAAFGSGVGADIRSFRF